MEIKMNKEIRDYAETMFFGLSLRQFLFSALGCLLSVGIFFLFRSDLVLQILSYVAQTERDFMKQRQAEGIAAAGSCDMSYSTFHKRCKEMED